MPDNALPDDATQRWLQPLMEEAARRGVGGDKIALMVMKAAFSTAEPDGHAVVAINPTNPDADAKLESLDYLRFGQLLRHELGWDDTYPDRPGNG
jgi:hypothetical protein